MLSFNLITQLLDLSSNYLSRLLFSHHQARESPLLQSWQLLSNHSLLSCPQHSTILVLQHSRLFSMLSYATQLQDFAATHNLDLSLLKAPVSSAGSTGSSTISTNASPLVVGNPKDVPDLFYRPINPDFIDPEFIFPELKGLSPAETIKTLVKKFKLLLFTKSTLFECPNCTCNDSGNFAIKRLFY